MKPNKNLFNNKTAKGLVSLIAIIVLLSSILATSIFYQNNITANVVRENSIDTKPSIILITEVNDIKELSQLNEGWYEVRNGFVFYLDTFNSYAPLYIRIAGIEYKDGLLVVDKDGNVEFSYRINGLNEKVIADEETEEIENEEHFVENEISGNVVGITGNAEIEILGNGGIRVGGVLKPVGSAFWDTKGTKYTVEKAGIKKEGENKIIYPVDIQGQGLSLSNTKPPHTTADGKITRIFQPGEVVVIDAGYGSQPYTVSVDKNGYYFLDGGSVIPSIPFKDPAATDLTKPPQESGKDKWKFVEVKEPQRTSQIDDLKIINIKYEPELHSLIDFTDKLTSDKREHINKLLKGVLVRGDIDDEENFKGETIDGRPVFIPADGSAVYYPGIDYNQENRVWVKNEVSGKSEISVSNLPEKLQEAFQPASTNEIWYKDPLTGVTVHGKPGETIYGVIDISDKEHDIKIPKSGQTVPPPAPAPAPTIGNLDPDYANPATSKVSKYVRLDNFELAKNNRECDKVNCEEIKPGQQWVKGVGVVDIANPQGLNTREVAGQIPNTKTEGPRRIAKISLNNQLVELYEKDKETNLQKIVVGRTYNNDGTIDKKGKELFVHPSIAAGLDLKTLSKVDIDGGTISLKTPQKSVDISLMLTTQTRTDIEYIKGEKNKKIETEVFIVGERKGETKTTTTLKPGTNQEQVTQATTLSDGSKIEVKYKQGSNDLNDATVTVTSSGRTSQFNGDLYNKIITQNIGVSNARINEIIVEATKAGIKIDKVERNILGDKNGVHLEFNDNSIFTMNKEVVTREKAKDGTVTDYEGNVKRDENGRPVLVEGSASRTFNAKDELTTYEFVKNNEKQTIKYEADKIVISALGDNIEIDRKFGFDPSDPNYGKVKILSGISGCPADGCIFEAGGTFFGFLEEKIPYITKSEVYYIDDKGKKQTIDIDPKSKELVERAGDQLRLYGVRDEKGNRIELPTARQLNSQRFFATVERVFTEFQGLGYYATLFFDEDSLLAWRDNVDRIFATLYLGTEYWSSAICGNYLDGEDIGIAYAETPQVLAQVGAHIEATKTEPITTENGTTQFIYKITFNVRNGDYDKDPRAPEEMNINVVLKGERTANVFRQEQKVKRGSSFGRVGSNAIVQDSKISYNEVCLAFDKLPLRWKLDNKELCNAIVESAGAATTIAATTATTAAGGGTAAGDVNDF
ncbi:hypothetical protein HYX04_03475 [Candidatus Woesearchaeota archaeon]|nr:hypothetical protein [Candidatus Woesearchaeota archaeon]